MSTDTLLLCYHAISPTWPAPLALPPSSFREHLSVLADRGYRGVTMTEAITGASVPKAVAITFDDAYRSVFEHARPILAETGFTASVFAPTAFVGTGRPMSWPGVEQWLDGEHDDELVPMSWGELKILAEEGWEVGSHTRTHPRLTELGDTELESELRASRDEIETRLDSPCRSLAYPFGAHDERVRTATNRAGYEAAAATLPGRLRRATGPYDWPRIVLNRPDTARRFEAKTSKLTRRAKSSPAWDAVAAGRRAARRLRSRS